MNAHRSLLALAVVALVCAAGHKIQHLIHDKAMFAPIVEPPLLSGVGGRLAEVPTIAGHPYVSPYEDLRLKAR